MAASTPQPLSLFEADSTWALIKDKVTEERFGPNVVAVPFLADAACYDLLGVLVKQKSKPPPWLIRLPRRSRRALLPVGPLPGLLERTGPEGAFAHCTREYSPRGRAEIGYEETRLVDGQPCRITLQLGGLRKRVAFLLLPPGQVSLQPALPWLRGTHSIYVIYQVFSCSWLQLGLAPTACEPRQLRLHYPLPVAFSCLKFALQPKGMLGPQRPLTGDQLPRKASWARPGPVLIPSLTSTLPSTLPDTDASPCQQPPTPPSQLPPEGRTTRFSYKGHNPFRRGSNTLWENWLFSSRNLSSGNQGGGPGDPDRHSMSLPLLQGLSAEFDNDD
uniref:Chromosome 11 open reading frame 42 n=1 Tax=Vombatus ursinus TaxID=29139 RepID=A0A4X2KB47_VOMUR